MSNCEEVKINNSHKTIKGLLGKALGEASMCWNPIPVGVFDSSKCCEILSRLEKEVNLRIEQAIEEENMPFPGRN